MRASISRPLLVENLDNGHAVRVRINDRGPFVDPRILDLSHAAARAVGAIGPGVIPVRLQVIGRPTLLSPPAPQRLTLRLGAR